MVTIAVGMVTASEQLEPDQLENFMMVGELVLNGAVRSVTRLGRSRIAAAAFLAALSGRPITRDRPLDYLAAKPDIAELRLFGQRSGQLNLKRYGNAPLLPFFAPLGTVLDPPIHLRSLKSDVVSLFLGFIPLVPQNFLVLSLEFSVEQRLFHQIVCRVRPLRFA